MLRTRDEKINVRKSRSMYMEMMQQFDERALNGDSVGKMRKRSKDKLLIIQGFYSILLIETEENII